MSESAGPKEEKMRLCPSCRMEISVLAVKCRFCGETVGRPRDESRALSIEDLGGETIQHYAPSSSVMEAMEAFRSEEDARPPEPVDSKRSQSFIGKFVKKEEPPRDTRRSSDSGLPQMDERSQALASLAMPSVRSSYQAPPKPPRSIPKMVGYFGGVVAGIVILYFGVTQVMAKREPVDPGPVVVNQAADMIERGDDPLMALQVSLDVESRDPHKSHKKVSSDARKLVLADISAHLDAKPWSINDLNRALELAKRATAIDTNVDVQRLYQEVDADWKDYNMALKAIAADQSTVTFVYGAGGNPVEETGSKGDIIKERFEIFDIRPDRVSVYDRKRGLRPLTWNRNGDMTSP